MEDPVHRAALEGRLSGADRPDLDTTRVLTQVPLPLARELSGRVPTPGFIRGVVEHNDTAATRPPKRGPRSLVPGLQKLARRRGRSGTRRR